MTSVLSDKLSSGPKGLGDPEDRTLRRVEKEILIPKIMRDKARTEKCTDFVKAFNDCCKENPILLVLKCRTENSRMKACLTDWYNNQHFQRQCEDIYLKPRSEYRRTGIKAQTKRMG
ncbi:unnamed protein product [Medioppia subpectinata]|uniref:COX assembly mitochondrial protein n=1 Tax=Medioppia subpectinata TaxID=1979941 RepID=A0A7R9L2U0_9ACAR|nr:unnamed protein product [Medioppia subpectinata]CAG2114280.1 unnamed protein product [Medioppia subpectinata]